MGMTITRRLFLFGWLVQARRPAPLQVEVMEVFLVKDGPCALLVHHADEASRNDFGRWLRANTGSRITCRQVDGKRMECTIFRVSLCFGRGLIVARTPNMVRPKEILTIFHL